MKKFYRNLSPFNKGGIWAVIIFIVLPIFYNTFFILSVPSILIIGFSSMMVCGGLGDYNTGLINCSDNLIISNLQIFTLVLIFVYIVGGLIGCLFNFIKKPSLRE